MDKISAMRVFIRVAELESFSKAATSLDMAKGSVSTTIHGLETLLVARLFERTTRQVRLTSEGRSFLERCKDLLADIEEVETMFQGDTGKIAGKIRVDMSTPVARDVVIPRLAEFLARYPRVEVDLSSSERRVDLIREGIDCVVRGGNTRDAGLAERPVGVVQFVNAASPAYLKTFGKPESVDDLKSHRLILFNTVPGSPAGGFEYHDGTKYRELKMAGSITVDTADAYKTACLAGLGICQTPRIGIAAELKQKRLVEILPGLKAEPMHVSIVFPQRRMLARRVRVFIDWLEPILKAHFA